VAATGQPWQPGNWRAWAPAIRDLRERHHVLHGGTLRYNGASPSRLKPNNNTPSMAVKQRQTPADMAPPRHGGDRRKRVLWSLMYGSFHPRRRGPRRAGEHTLTAVDWHHPQWLAIGTLIVALSCADAFLTLVLIGQGAYEMNPFMAPLVGGSAVGFALVKISLTAVGVLLLTQLARLRTFGRIPVGAILYSVLALYGTLIFYEFRLLAHL
jgi:hypothetical protein